MCVRHRLFLTAVEISDFKTTCSDMAKLLANLVHLINLSVALSLSFLAHCQLAQNPRQAAPNATVLFYLHLGLKTCCFDGVEALLTRLR